MRSRQRIVPGMLPALPWISVAALAAWLLWPALTAVHVEGFSASIVALGLHVGQGTVADFMPFAPFNTDYFGLTKLGVVLGVTALSPLFGGDGAMQVMMLCGFVLLMAASADLIRRWTGARWLVIAVVLLLTPGVAESAFFFNDNLPSAALLVLALAILARVRSWPWAILAGALIGAAVAIRTDAVLVAVAATPLIALKGQDLRRAAVTTTVSATAAVIVLFAIFALVGSIPLDAVRAGALATRLWDRPAGLLMPLVQFLYFCGLPGLVLMLLGAFELRRRKDWRTLALLAGVPLVCSAILVESLWEARQFLPFTPFLCGLAALGAESTLSELRERRIVVPAVVAVCAAMAVLGPPGGLMVSDGPRLLSGRVFGIGFWNDWQVGVRQDMANVDRLVAGLPPGRPAAVLTDGWDDDRYLHLKLVEAGFRRTAAPPACGMIGEAMRKGDRTVVQLTLLQSFVPYWPALQPQRLEQGALPCIAALRPAEVILLGRKARIDGLLRARQGSRLLGGNLSLIRTSPIVWVGLDSNGLAALDAAYRREAAATAGSHDLAKAQAAMASQTPFSRSAVRSGL